MTQTMRTAHLVRNEALQARYGSTRRDVLTTPHHACPAMGGPETGGRKARRHVKGSLLRDILSEDTDSFLQICRLLTRCTLRGNVEAVYCRAL